MPIESKRPDHSILKTVLVMHPTIPGETIVVNAEDAAGFELAPEPAAPAPAPPPKRAAAKKEAAAPPPENPPPPPAGGEPEGGSQPEGGNDDSGEAEQPPPGAPKADFPLVIVKGIGERLEGVLGAKLAAAGMGGADAVLSAGADAVAAVLGDHAHLAPKVIEAAKAATAKA